MSIRTITITYQILLVAVVVAALLMSRYLPWIALALILSYIAVPPLFFNCPRCGLNTSARMSRMFPHKKSIFVAGMSPKQCSRCGLDFRNHRFSDRF